MLPPMTYERQLRMALFHDSVGDDSIQAPWVSIGPVQARGWGIHIHLKDVETMQGENDRLARWTRIARHEAERFLS